MSRKTCFLSGASTQHNVMNSNSSKGKNLRNRLVNSKRGGYSQQFQSCPQAVSQSWVQQVLLSRATDHLIRPTQASKGYECPRNYHHGMTKPVFASCQILRRSSCIDFSLLFLHVASLASLQPIVVPYVVGHKTLFQLNH